MVAAPSEFGEDEVRACVVSSASDFDPRKLVAYLREQVAPFKVPRYIDVLETLPRSGAKREIEKFKLQARDLALAWDSARDFGRCRSSKKRREGIMNREESHEQAGKQIESSSGAGRQPEVSEPCGVGRAHQLGTPRPAVAQGAGPDVGITANVDQDRLSAGITGPIAFASRQFSGYMQKLVRAHQRRLAASMAARSS